MRILASQIMCGFDDVVDVIARAVAARAK